MTGIRLLTAAAAFALTTAAAPAPLPLDRLTKTGTVDERFQGYNIEMVEVTGGRFWAPYGGPKDEVYRQRQDAEYLSDFDKEIKRLEGKKKP